MHTNDEVHGTIVVTYATPYLFPCYSFLIFGTRFLDHTLSLFIYFSRYGLFCQVLITNVI